MKAFLETVAGDLLAKNGNDLSQTVIVFPNKRASLFLNDALAKAADGPVWSPAYTTISDLFRSHSTLHVADPIKLVCDLHRVYTEVTGIDETLDHFYGWGQLLLSDFDDIDKNMAPAQQVFANLRDIHELDDVSYLTDEQRAVIRKFFSNFSDTHNSLLKERFLKLWSNIGAIYQRYNELLRSQQLAYEGALYRQVADDDSIDFGEGQYVFVGFNLLQQAEQRLFDRLRRMGKARFYWDFDRSYLDSEAGTYIRQHLQRFPNETDTDEQTYQCFCNPKTISFITAPTENIQARYVSQWLRQRPDRIADGRRTAVVLCNEALLPTVIHTLPDAVEHVNVTTGYPLQLTPAASLIQQMTNLHTMGFDHQRNTYRLRFVSPLLRHPYMTMLSDAAPELLKNLQQQHIYYPTPQLLSADEGLALLFGTSITDNSTMMHWMTAVISRIARKATGQLDAESLFRAYTLANRIATLIDNGDLTVDAITLSRLLTQLIQQTTIPFHGEPAVGLQIMGVLETRNLDFDHLLLLSTNEGNMPRSVSDSSFIPYSIRKAFSLTTVENKVAIYAYYFYRLLSRASDITIVYNNTANEGQTGEMSRFMLQLLVEGNHNINLNTLQAADSTDSNVEISTEHHEVEKTPQVMEILRQRFTNLPTPQQEPSPLLTPTAINRYMRCQLQFYYNYVEGLREPDEPEDDEIDNRIFGNIFHEAAYNIYKQMAPPKTVITAAMLDEQLKRNDEIERCVDAAISKELFRLNNLPNLPDLNGLQIINRKVIIHYLRTLIQNDRQLAPFTILELEKDITAPLHIKSAGIDTIIGGRIDRLDIITLPNLPNLQNLPSHLIRVIDYKTGGRRLKPMKDIEALFDPTQIHNHSDYYLQAMLYARLVQKQIGTHTPVAPALLFIQHASSENYSPILQIGNERQYSMQTPDADRFETLLEEKIEEIFNPELPFCPTADSDICRTCPYTNLCGVKTGVRTQKS